MPEDGSQLRLTDSARIRMMPSQNAGTDTPMMLTAARRKSGTELRRRAASTPIGIPTTTDNISATPASRSVFGKR